MPTLDFTRVLNSPRFKDKFLVTPVKGVIGPDGMEIDTTSRSIWVSGIVVPGKLSTLRTADGSRVNAFIDIYSQRKLTPGYKKKDGNTNTREADRVTWHGRIYLVNTVEDYGAFGRGFYKASCDLLTVTAPN